MVGIRALLLPDHPVRGQLSVDCLSVQIQQSQNFLVLRLGFLGRAEGARLTGEVSWIHRAEEQL